MAIWVTGGAGNIGSHAARALRRSGSEVVLCDNLSIRFERLARGFELVKGDVADKANLKPVLARVNAVVHFATVKFVASYFRPPAQCTVSPTKFRLASRRRGTRFHFHASCSGFTRFESYGTMAEVKKPFGGVLRYQSQCSDFSDVPERSPSPHVPARLRRVRDRTHPRLPYAKTLDAMIR